MLRIIRLFGGAFGVVLGIALTSLGGPSGVIDREGPQGLLLLVVWLAAWFVIGYAILPYVTIEPARWLVRAVSELSTGEFVTAIGGLLVGLLMGLLMGLPLTNLPEPYGWLLPVGVSLVLGLGMMGLTVAKRADLRQAMLGLGVGSRARSTDVPAAQELPPTYLDTSAIIDGRLVDVVASGFLAGRLVVPRFVLGELQHIADDSQAGRRSRGRRGLDVLEVLQKDHRIQLDLSDEDGPPSQPVDGKLVALARAAGGAILTTDYNLNRVAQLHGVRVMNLNQLANALKPVFLPGEEVRVKLVQAGKEPGQGVGFLDDGTMVVVEGGGVHLQNEIDVTVTRILQTVAGRMVFAELGARPSGS
jgi:uncharacterized protein YacL